MTKVLETSYESVRHGIVAFAPFYKLKYSISSIFGTGFIVGEHLVVTNRHVIEVFRKFKRPGQQSPDICVLIFENDEKGSRIYQLKVQASIYVDHSPETKGKSRPPADVGLVSIACSGLEKYALNINAAGSEQIGRDVATAGFTMGSELIFKDSYLSNISPILQAGIISAKVPSFKNEPDGYLINMMHQGCASGSPVFLPENGEVIGVVYKKVLEDQISINTNFTYVVASKHIKKTIDDNKDKLLNAIKKTHTLEEYEAQSKEIPANLRQSD